jgi:hypothetical protein
MVHMAKGPRTNLFTLVILVAELVHFLLDVNGLALLHYWSCCRKHVSFFQLWHLFLVLTEHQEKCQNNWKKRIFCTLRESIDSQDH